MSECLELDHAVSKVEANNEVHRIRESFDAYRLQSFVDVEMKSVWNSRHVHFEQHLSTACNGRIAITPHSIRVNMSPAKRREKNHHTYKYKRTDEEYEYIRNHLTYNQIQTCTNQIRKSLMVS